MFSALADKLDTTFRNLRGVGRISEKNISDALREIRLALLEADVEYKVAQTFIENVKKMSSVVKDVVETAEMEESSEAAARKKGAGIPRRTAFTLQRATVLVSTT